MLSFPRRLLAWALSAAFAGLAGWLFLRGQPAGLPLDDAYIHLVYAQNLAQGLGWCFNPGEPSLGTSSPLWVILLSVLLPRLAPQTAALALAWAAFLLSSLLVAEIGQVQLSRRRPEQPNLNLAAAVFAAALFAFSGNLLWLAFCGMETIVFLFLGLLALRGFASGRPNWLGALSLAGLILCRIEGWLLYLLILVWFGREQFHLSPADRNLKPGLWLILPPAGWLAWTLFTWLRFHELLPSTMQGKLASNLFNSGLNLKGPLLFLWRHLVYFSHWPAELLLLLCIAAAGLAFVFPRRRPDSATKNPDSPPTPLLALTALWALANLLLHALFFRSTAAITPYHYLRYQAPLFPALCLAAAATLSLWPGSTPLARASGVLLILLVTAAVGLSFPHWKKQRAQNLLHLQLAHRAAAEWAQSHLPKDARLAAFDIGSLKFFSGKQVLDLAGLVDPGIHPYLKERRVGPYLVQRGADYYFALDRPAEEGLIGVRKDQDRLYRLQELVRFDGPDYATPVLLHSRRIIVYKLEPLP